MAVVATIGIVHGAGDSGWSWHLVVEALRDLGHRAVAPDLPAGDEAATLADYTDAVIDAMAPIGDGPVVIVGQSWGAFTAPLVADRLGADLLVLISAMVPRPGEKPDDWWGAVGYSEAVAEAAASDGGLTGNDDPFVSFLHDVPRDLAEEVMGRGREYPSTTAGAMPWPLDTWPDVPTRFILCTEDRFFPPALMRRMVADRLPGVPIDEIAASHGVTLSRPRELAALIADHVPE